MPPKKYTAPRPAVAADADAPPPKQRKPRAPPSGMSNADWKADIVRRAAATTDRRNRSNKQKERAAAAAASAATETSRARMMPPPGHHQVAWSQPNVGSPASFTPPSQPWGCAPSPGYGAGDVHGGFNPNTALAFLMAADATAVSAMDGPIREWYMRERGLILDGLPTDTPTATTNTSTRPASPSDDVSPTSTPSSPRTPTTDNNADADADAEADAETQDGAAEDIATAVI